MSSKVLVINPSERKVYESEITDFHSILKLLECSVLDALTLKLYRINGDYTIYFDDLGKLKPHYISAMSGTNPDFYLAGNLVISKTDDEGNDVPLTSEECNDIIFNSIVSVSVDGYTNYPILMLA